MHENREIYCTFWSTDQDRSAKAINRTADMNVQEKSDCAVVPMNQPNKEGRPSAEVGERRAQTEENIVQSHMRPTQSGRRMSQGLGGVRQVARKRKQERLTALLHYLNVGLIRESCASCILTLGSDSRHVTTDGSGQIEEDIPPDIHDAALVIQDAQTPLDNTRIAIRIGDLDPVTEISGQIARLNNLGYFAGDIKSPDHVAVESAVEEFQCDNNLTVDGICGPKTQAQLKKVHGC